MLNEFSSVWAILTRLTELVLWLIAQLTASINTINDHESRMNWRERVAEVEAEMAVMGAQQEPHHKMETRSRSQKESSSSMQVQDPFTSHSLHQLHPLLHSSHSFTLSASRHPTPTPSRQHIPTP